MKKTFFIDAFRNIIKRFVSWLSIVAIVLIGTSVILGLRFTSTSLMAIGGDFINDHVFKDLTIVCSMGITEEELDTIRSQEGVRDAEGAVSVAGQISFDDKSIGALLMSYTDRINVPYATDGSLPVNDGECALNKELLEKLGANIGDTISIVISAARLDNILETKEFTITGIAVHPDHMVPGRMDYCILPASSFNTEQSAFDYTAVYLMADTPKGANFSDKSYNSKVKEVDKLLEAGVDEMTAKKLQTIGDDLEEEYRKGEEKAKSELAKAKKQIEDGQKEFDQKVAEAQQKIEDVERQYAEGKETAEKEIKAAEKKIRDGEAEYNTKIADGEKQLAAAEKQLETELNEKKWLIFEASIKLDDAERLLKEKEEAYNEGAGKLAQGREEFNAGKEAYNEAIKKLDETLNVETLDAIIDSLNELKEETEEPEDIESIDSIISVLSDLKGREPIDRGYGVIALYDGLLDGIELKIKAVIDDIVGMSDFRDILNKLSDAKIRLDDGQQKLDDAAKTLVDARNLLDTGWSELYAGQAQLAQGQAELAKKEPEARQQLADAKAEYERQKADGAKQIQDAKNLLASKKKEVSEQLAAAEKELAEGKEEFRKQKEKGEKELADARQKYAEGEKEALEKLAEARKQIDEAKNTPCEWFIQTRDANVNYVQFKAYFDVLDRIGKVFTPIYIAVVVVVCFFTMAIIVEEQSKQIGTCKAFGMYKGEIRNKYLLFGATASLFGAFLGIIGGFGFEKLICTSINATFVFGNVPHKFELWPFIAIPVGAVLVTSFAVAWSSEKILSCSAVGLVSGNEPAKRGRTKGSKNTFGTVYFRLIINNFIMDMGREIISVIIILVCIVLIGLGTSVKLGHASALKNQVYNIFLYDISATISEKATDEEKAEVLERIKGYDYMEVCHIGGVIQDDEKQTLTDIYCVDDKEKFKEFFALQDRHGKAQELSDDGVMVSYEMEEKGEMHDGKEFIVVTDSMSIAKVTVNGHFMYHTGKCTVTTGDYFRNTFGAEPKANTYLIKVGSEEQNALFEDLSRLDGVSSVNMSDELLDKKAGMSRLYTAVVCVVVGFSIILSFMILLNLSNILVAHRMRELLTMRVNGFSNGQVIGYLVRELLVTTSLGIILGLVIGIPATAYSMLSIESDGFMFFRKTYWLAWGLAVACEVVFSLIINSIAFRGIKKVPLTDITKY